MRQTLGFSCKFLLYSERFADGLWAHFLFVVQILMDYRSVIETAVRGLGYELVDCERSGSRGVLRVFVEGPKGIGLEDCARISRHLVRVLTVEGVEYDRLEVSSPGLDRVLRKEEDFVRFAGEKARIKLRVPQEGQRNFIGVLRAVNDGKVELEVEGRVIAFELANLARARLVPQI
jgi:ribosome maturation factor RimP